jgi:hypothetical protein
MQTCQTKNPATLRQPAVGCDNESPLGKLLAADVGEIDHSRLAGVWGEARLSSAASSVRETNRQECDPHDLGWVLFSDDNFPNPRAQSTLADASDRSGRALWQLTTGSGFAWR